MLGQVAWTIIRLEIHHLWNPDWTYAFPQPSEPEAVVMDDEGAYYPQDEEDYGVNGGAPGGPGSDYEGEQESDPLIDSVQVQDGAIIPLLQVSQAIFARDPKRLLIDSFYSGFIISTKYFFQISRFTDYLIYRTFQPNNFALFN